MNVKPKRRATKSLVRVGVGKEYPCLYIHPNGVYYFKTTVLREPLQCSLLSDNLSVVLPFWQNILNQLFLYKLTGVEGELIKKMRHKHKRIRLYSALSEWLKQSAAKDESGGYRRGKRVVRKLILSSGISYIDQISQESIDRIYDNMVENENKINTRIFNIKLIKLFLKFCIEKQYLDEKLYSALKFKALKYQKRTQGAVINEKDYHKILSHPEISSNNIRKAYLMALWELGLRPQAEGVEVQYEDIDWENRTVMVVQSKTEESTEDCIKYVPMTEEFAEHLKYYCESNNITSGELFRNARNNPGTWLAKHWSRIRSELGINSKYKIYSFRHTFAKRMDELTHGNVHFVQDVMGHTSLEHTDKYLHSLGSGVTKILDEAIAKKKKLNL